MRRRRIPLGNHIVEYSVRNKNDESIPVYSVTNSQGFCQEYFGKEVASKDKMTYKIVPYGYFAYNPSRINVGSVDWQHCEERVIVSPLYNVFSVSDKIDRQYLLYFLKSDIGRQIIRVKASGSVRDNLKLEMLREMTIPDITIDEQRQCSVTLDQLNSIIELHKKQLTELDNLVKARFVEMFGDPIINNFQLPTLSGTDFFKLSNGKFVPEEKRFETGIPVYGGNGISWYTDETLISADTLVVGRVGFQSGNVHYAEGPLWVSDNAMYVSYYDKGKYDLLFLCHLMEHIDFTRHQDAGDLKKITQKPFMAMEYIFPSLSRQREYTAFVEQVDKSKAVVQQALDEAQTLFDSLMQQYFG